MWPLFSCHYKVGILSFMIFLSSLSKMLEQYTLRVQLHSAFVNAFTNNLTTGIYFVLSYNILLWCSTNLRSNILNFLQQTIWLQKSFTKKIFYNHVTDSMAKLCYLNTMILYRYHFHLLGKKNMFVIIIQQVQICGIMWGNNGYSGFSN